MDRQIIKDIKGLEIIGGQITKRLEADESKGDVALGNIKVLAPKAIKGGKIDNNELYELNYVTEPDEKKLTKEGDIILKLSTPYDAAIVRKENVGILVTSFCAIIRNNEVILDNEYLAAFLNSDVYLKQAQAVTSGATMPILSIGKVKDMTIPVPSKEEQAEIGEYYTNLTERKALMEQIFALETEKLNSIIGGVR